VNISLFLSSISTGRVSYIVARGQEDASLVGSDEDERRDSLGVEVSEREVGDNDDDGPVVSIGADRKTEFSRGVAMNELSSSIGSLTKSLIRSWLT